MMKLDNCYYLEYRTIDLICNVILTTFRPIYFSVSFMCFMSNSESTQNFELNPLLESQG